MSAWSTARAAPTCAPASSRAAPARRCTRARSHARRLAVDAKAFDEDGNQVVGELGELVITSPMPSMPVALWGDEDGERYRVLVLRPLPGRVAPGRLDQVHPSAAAACSPGAPTRRSTAAGCGWVPASSTRWWRSSPSSPTRSSSTSRTTRAGWASCCCSWCPRRARRRRRGPGTRSLGACAASSRPVTCPTTSSSSAAIPRTLTGKKLEAPVKRILRGEAAEKVASRDSLADPGALDAFVALAAERGAQAPLK